jgi:hypothetical protein
MMRRESARNTRDFEALEKQRMATARLFPTDLNNSQIGD